jgi:hypothetical protein
MAICFLVTAMLPSSLVKIGTGTAKCSMLSLLSQIKIHDCSSVPVPNNIQWGNTFEIRHLYNNPVNEILGQ